MKLPSLLESLSASENTDNLSRPQFLRSLRGISITPVAFASDLSQF